MAGRGPQSNDGEPGTRPHPRDRRAEDSGGDRSDRQIRFSQARSIGILLVLLALLGLVVFNAVAQGSPWIHRDRDVRLLMTLLSVLLGVDVLIGNHREIARLVGRVLVAYADRETTPFENTPPHQPSDPETPPARPYYPPNDSQPHSPARTAPRDTDTGSDSETDDADADDDRDTGGAGGAETTPNSRSDDRS